MSTPETPRIDELQAALDQGDLDSVRRTLLSIDGREADLLEQGLGAEAFERARRAAARGRRRGKLGKVLVLPGIMGTELDSVDRKGDVDRIWIDFVRLLAGRIGDLELTPEGEPAKAGIHVRPAGLHQLTYVPILLELDTRWHVRPFPFDWREDIDKSAARLDAEITAFGAGEPVHLVAHSMGGLVSRRFAQQHPATWKAMDDTTAAGRGGRLVMLGTPNRGSFAIPLTLSGAEKILKVLAVGDIHHSMKQLLAIIGTFPGMYQMLPSPLADLGPDEHHKKLYDVASWGALPARAPLLALADAFQRDLDAVIDPHRLLYVAGANRETPVGIRIESAGKFSYRKSLDGDGRVPHELGLLEGVTTYWVDETHGDLAKNGHVLDAITELLQTGKTTVLPTTKPAKPTRAAPSRDWEPADAVAPLPVEARAIAEKAKVQRRSTGEPHLTPEEQERLRNLTLAEYLGSGQPPGPGVRGGVEEEAFTVEGEDAGEGEGTEPRADTPSLQMEIEVVWGDVTKVDADVYAVGHYEGVTPQYAELALDEAVSGVRGRKEYEPRKLVITQHAARGSLHADLGDVSFFPWGDARNANRVVAVAGMGRPGTFDGTGLRRLVGELIVAITQLPPAIHVCSVLIGSGEGTLSIQQAVSGWLDGIADAAEEIATAGVYDAPVERIVFAERDRGRAEELHGALEEELTRRAAEERPRSVALTLARRLKRGTGGTVSIEESVAQAAESLVKAAVAAAGSQEQAAYTTLLEQCGPNATVRKLLLQSFLKEGGRERPSTKRPRFRVERRMPPPPSADTPARISFWDDGQTIRAAAIHQAATVPERFIGVGRDVVDDLIVKMTDPPASDVDDLCRLLQRLLVPSEFGDVLLSPSLVFEVDRSLARLHWEMQPGFPGSQNGEPMPLSVSKPFARQMRTAYSPTPVRPARPGGGLRALVIGDPGDPEKGQDLPGAMNEALKVKELLESRDGVFVEARIGAPGATRPDELYDVKPADRLEVLALLLNGDFDLVHYAGHGDFDPEQPSRVGWVFARGLLTPGEIGRLERVPAVIVSNACLSARTSFALDGARRPDEAKTEAGLLPSLADEFFKLGVRNYIGTAWEVNDIGAELFARVFYASLLAGETFGVSVKKAREALWQDRETYGALWAAYQHYGDPASSAVLAPQQDGDDN